MRDSSRVSTDRVRATAPGVEFAINPPARPRFIRGASRRIADGNVQAPGGDAGLAGDNWTRLASEGAAPIGVANRGFLARYDEAWLVASRRDGPWLIPAREVWKFAAPHRAARHCDESATKQQSTRVSRPV